MKKILLSIPFILLIACHSEHKEKDKPKKVLQNNSGEVSNPEKDLYTAIQSIDKRRPDAISQAVLTYKNSKTHNSPLSCDRDLVVLKNFAISAAIALNESGYINNLTLENGKIRLADERKFNRLGYLVSYVDGEAYFVASPSYLLENMQACLSGPMMEFMHEFDLEARNNAVQGEALNISLDELERRLLFWENFLLENPEFILRDEANTTYHFFLSLYMTGTGTSRAFSPDQLQFNPEYKKSYERILKKTASPTADFIKGYYHVLKENNFFYSTKVDEYINTVKSPFHGL